MNWETRSRRLLRPFAVGTALFCLLSTAASAETLSYLFNDAPGSAAAAPTGTAAGSAPALNIVGPAAIGANGSGVSGLPTDRALNNTAASSMGGTVNSSGGRGTHAADFEPIDGLLKFTISGWFKTDSTAPVGGNAVLVYNRLGAVGVGLHAAPSTPGSLVLDVDNGGVTSAGFGATQSWVNFAVTYDGTILQPGPNVFFYAGGINTPLALAGSGTNTNGSGNDPASNDAAPLSIGSRVTFGALDGDPFDGLLDNIRISNEIVPLATLEAQRLTDTGVPEPSTALTASLGALLIGARVRRRSA